MKKRSKRISRIIVVLIFAAAVGLIARNRLSNNTEKPTSRVVEEVLSAEVHSDTVSQKLVTASAIKDAERETVSLAGYVKVKQWKVSEGDYVSEGQEIASVDQNTLKSAMAYVDKRIADIDKSLKKAKIDVKETVIKAPVSGRVKEVYVAVNDMASDVLYEKGALVVISLDGKMAVDIECTSLLQGETVTVMLPDGTELDGTVSELLDGSTVVTVPDNLADIGDEATVQKNGTVLGSGFFYIHSELKLSEYTGKVVDVFIKKNDTVKTGNGLFVLRETGQSVEYQMLLAQRRELEEDMDALFSAYDKGMITAPYNGRISKLYDEEEDDPEAEETELYEIDDYSELEFTVSVDEMDVLDISVGDKAEVTLDAIQGEKFEAEVTDINFNGKNVGGHTKYTVTLTMPRTRDMLTGMNLSVKLPISEKTVPVIPIEALNEDSNGTFVYTSYDEETGELSGPVYITTGISDEKLVEVRSGIAEGDTVLYRYADRIEYVFEN